MFETFDNLRTAFLSYDHDRSGAYVCYLTAQGLIQAADRLTRSQRALCHIAEERGASHGIRPQWLVEVDRMTSQADELTALMEQYDTNGDGSLQYNEFVKVAPHDSRCMMRDCGNDETIDTTTTTISLLIMILV